MKPRGIDALPTVRVVGLVKIEERELDIGHEDGCFRSFLTTRRPEVQLELECDMIDAARFNVEHTESRLLIEPVVFDRIRAVLGCVADDEVHHAAQPCGGSCAHHITENHFAVVRMSVVEVMEPALKTLILVVRGQRIIALTGAGPHSTEVVAAKRGR